MQVAIKVQKQLMQMETNYVTKGSLTSRFYPQETSIVRLGVGGGGLAAVTFLYNTWENSIFLLKKFCTFWKHLGKGYKITFALNSSISSFCFSQNLYCLYSSLGLEMRFCAQTICVY